MVTQLYITLKVLTENKYTDSIARNYATQTNFGGDEYNWASWIRIVEGDYDITINAPKYFDHYMKRYSITIDLNNSI